MNGCQTNERLNLNKKLFAISGVKGSGKDSVTDMLQYCLSVPKAFRQYWFYKHFRKWIKPKYKKLAFADPLKKMLSDLLSISLDKFYNRDFKEGCIINIPTLESSWLGWIDRKTLSDSKFNKMVKQLDPSLTEANLTLRQLLQYFGTEIMQKYFGKQVWVNATLRDRSEYKIISDLRFIEEYNAIKEHKGIIIYIDRPGYQFGQHASEKEMKELYEHGKYDYIIKNNGSLEELFNKIKDLVNSDFTVDNTFNKLFVDEEYLILKNDI